MGQTIAAVALGLGVVGRTPSPPDVRDVLAKAADRTPDLPLAA